MEKTFETYEKVLGKENTKTYLDKSESIIKDKSKLVELLNDVEKRLKEVPKIGEVLAYAPLFVEIIRSYIAHEYDKIPAGTLVAMVLALFYMVNPMDLIPDALPGIGAVDDALIFAVTAALVKADVDEYVKWRDK